jgi:hypothetical protein
MPCAAKAPNTKKDLFMGSYFLFWYSCIRFARVWFFSSEKNETKKLDKMCTQDKMKNRGHAVSGYRPTGKFFNKNFLPHH